MLRSGQVSMFNFHQSIKNEAAQTSVSTWEGHTSRLICEETKYVTACGLRYFVPLLRASPYDYIPSVSDHNCDGMSPDYP